MADKRMFSLKIVDTDQFLDMPVSARLLYYDLGMRADDDGFISSPKKIIRMVGCAEDDFKLLAAKGFILVFESGVCVVRDWLVHNYIKKDRYTETRYREEKQRLFVEKNRAYTLCPQDGTGVDTGRNQTGDKMEPQVRLELDQVRDREEGDCKGEKVSPPPTPKPEKKVYGEFGNVLLTNDEHRKLVEKLGTPGCGDYIERLSGWLAEGHRKKNHYATILNWSRKDSPSGLQPAGERRWTRLE